MIRTQIQLPEKEYRQLRQAAKGLGRSMADCIREGIRLFLDRRREAKDDLLEIAGKFPPLPATDIKPHDEWLAEAILKSKSPSHDR